jgi:peptide-methionine (S)-S-oxide reductase
MLSQLQSLFARIASVRTRYFSNDMMGDDSGKENVATFAAGCFWGVEHIFNKYFPELKTTVGYSNGKKEINNPSYRQVCNGGTDFAEAVRIEFDPAKVSYAQLVGE